MQFAFLAFLKSITQHLLIVYAMQLFIFLACFGYHLYQNLRGLQV
jgi:hypothetical protein